MESLDTLNGYTAKNLENWLKMQLKQIYFSTHEEKYRACDFRHLGVSRGESHIDALQGLFKILSDNAREQFREALGRILQHANPNDFPKDAMADIVKLTGLTDAYEIFPTFVSVLGSGEWGERYPSLIYDALSVLMMFNRSDEVYESAKGLATSTHFQNALVFDAYLVMVRSRPENWREDYMLLRQRFNKIIENVKSSVDAGILDQLHRRQRSLAQSLSEAVQLSELGGQLASLDFDDWLIDNLLQPSGAISLKWNKDIDGMVIIDDANPTRIAKVETTPSFEVASIYRGWIFGYTDDSDPQGSIFPDNAHLHEKTLTRLRNASGARFDPASQEAA